MGMTPPDRAAITVVPVAADATWSVMPITSATSLRPDRLMRVLARSGLWRELAGAFLWPPASRSTQRMGLGERREVRC